MVARELVQAVAAIFGSPVIERRLANARLPTNLRDRCALISLAQDERDLLSLNFDFRMQKFLRPARNRKLEFSSRKRSKISGAGHSHSSIGAIVLPLPPVHPALQKLLGEGAGLVRWVPPQGNEMALVFAKAVQKLRSQEAQSALRGHPSPIRRLERSCRHFRLGSHTVRIIRQIG
jgi:hypothetical protein